MADVIANQWWMGYKPEALRKENKTVFDLDKPLPSNMVALVCSAVRPSLPVSERNPITY